LRISGGEGKRFDNLISVKGSQTAGS